MNVTENDSEDTETIRMQARTLINDDLRMLMNITNQPNIGCTTPDCGPSSAAYLKSSSTKSVSESIKDARKRIKDDWDDLKNSSIEDDDNIIKKLKSKKNNRKALDSEILAGVVVYIEIPNKQRIYTLKQILTSMGATVSLTFSKVVTHVIYKRGTLETYKRAKLLNVHLVSVLWVESCKNSKRRMDEKLFPVLGNNDSINTPRKLRKFLEHQSNNLIYDDNTRTLIRKVQQNTLKNLDVLNFNTHSKNNSLNISKNDAEITRTESPSSLAETSSKESFRLRISSSGSESKSKKNDEDENLNLNKENENILTSNINNADKNIPDNVNYISTSKRRLFVKQPMKESFLKISLSENSDNSQNDITPLPNPYETVNPKKNVTKNSNRNNIRQRINNDNDLIQTQNSNFPKSINAREIMSLFPLTQTTVKKSQKSKKKNCTLVSTFLHSDENKLLKHIISKLGRFHFKTAVDDNTTHIVAGESQRTINLLKGIAKGCWILKKSWFIESDHAGYWLAEDQYELVEFSRMVQRSRIQRQTFGKHFGLDIFDECGLIFVGENSKPSRKDITQLVKLCGGNLTTNIESADIVLGEYCESKTCVMETWVLDSITIGRCRTKIKYYIKSSI